MSLDEGVSRFIGRIYESAYDADAWRASIKELMQRTSSRLVFVCCADVRHREYSRAEFYGPDTSAFAVGHDEYVEEMYTQDPSLLWASAHPDAGVCDTARIMADDDFRRLPYVNWQRSRFGTEHWRVFFTKPVDDLSFALSLHPRGGRRPSFTGAGQAAQAAVRAYGAGIEAGRAATRPCWRNQRGRDPRHGGTSAVDEFPRRADCVPGRWPQAGAAAPRCLLTGDHCSPRMCNRLRG